MSNDPTIPPVDDDRESKLALLFSELADRIQRGEDLSFEVESQKHPHFASDLKELWGAMHLADAVGSGSIAKVQDGSKAALTIPFADPSGMALPAEWSKYRLLEELGRGGMGIVYLAEDRSLGRQVAIKMILRERLVSVLDRQRFFAEASALAKLEHPGIVQVYEVGEIEGRPYFTMQRVRGNTLASEIAAGPISQRRAARLVAQVARSIHFAHERGILHRDIKPSNILVDEQDQAKLTDFGLAKRFDDPLSLTRTGAVLGTPNYMSPEQAMGRGGSLGPASDIYSLGTVLYHATTGRPPLVADTPVQLAFQIVEQDPPPPRLLNPQIDPDLEMILVRCLQKPPDLRYASAAELALDLEAYLEGRPVLARTGRLEQIFARVFRETHHAPVLENWGLLWMWHSLILFLVCVSTWALQFFGNQQCWPYIALWIVGLGAWAIVFWKVRSRMGPVTFVERQIAHVWGASMIAIAMVFPLEWWLDLKPLTLSPMLGIISSMVFLIKGGILSGAFYLQAAVLIVSAVLMAAFPPAAHLIFGVAASACFFFPGLKYYRRLPKRFGNRP